MENISAGACTGFNIPGQLTNLAASGKFLCAPHCYWSANEFTWGTKKIMVNYR